MKGDIENFNKNWKSRTEAVYSHWTRVKPVNQIQFAFRQHWKLFKQIFKRYPLLKKSKKSTKVLEVGCGRGTMSAYFADNNYDTYLLDKSKKAMELAKKYFKKNNLKANFYTDDCLKLPFENNKFDIIFSIGLMEHFKNPEKAISEKFRVLKKGGINISYIVPNKKVKVQEEYHWINEIIHSYYAKKSTKTSKFKVYRSNYNLKFYKKLYKKFTKSKINCYGIYPLPMISHSIDFPFSLMNDKIEKDLVLKFEKILTHKYKNFSSWLCDEDYGQAIIIWATK